MNGRLYGQSGRQAKTPYVWCNLHKSAAASADHEVWTPVSFTGKFWDFSGVWNPSQPTRIYLPVFGIWRFFGALSWVTNATGRRELGISLNTGEGDLAYASQPAVATSSGATSQSVGPVTLVLGPPNYVVLMGRQDSGGPLNNTFANFEVQLLAVLAGSDYRGYNTTQVSARS